MNIWEKDRRFVVSRVLKDEKVRAQISFLEGEDYDYFFFVTNTEQSSEEVVEFYDKRGNCENYIKEAKYDMAVGRLLLQSFWANEAIILLMMLAYNLFLLFKMDFAGETEYRQQIKTFRLKYIFLAGKIIRTARSVVMKLSEKYPYRELYEKSYSSKNTHYHVSTRYFYLSQAEKIISNARICESGSLNLMQAGRNDAIIRPR